MWLDRCYWCCGWCKSGPINVLNENCCWNCGRQRDGHSSYEELVGGIDSISFSTKAGGQQVESRFRGLKRERKGESQDGGPEDPKKVCPGPIQPDQHQGHGLRSRANSVSSTALVEVIDKASREELPAADNSRELDRVTGYAVRLKNKNEFVHLWECKVLPFLEDFLPPILGSNFTVDIFKDTVPDSGATRRTIFFLSPTHQSYPNKVRIAGRVLELLPNSSECIWRFRFLDGNLERTVCSAWGTGWESPDLVCHARRPHYMGQPNMGASIGLQGTDEAATLGGYILLDGNYHMLTVHHLFSEEESEEIDSFSPIPPSASSQFVVQPSELERRCLIKQIEQGTSELQLQTLGKDAVQKLRRHLNSLEAALREIPASTKTSSVDLRVGKYIGSSGYRARVSRVQSESGRGPDLVEMDWACCSTLNRHANFNVLFKDYHNMQIYDPAAPNDLSAPNIPPSMRPCSSTKGFSVVDTVTEVDGDTPVHSVARTSGYSTGRTSEARGLYSIQMANGNRRVTREWSVGRAVPQTEDDWVTGGMGVTGDSGSFVVEMESGTNAFYGMIWARYPPFGSGERIAHFTPFMDIAADIRERLPTVKDISLPLFSNFSSVINCNDASAGAPSPMQDAPPRGLSHLDHQSRSSSDTLADAMDASSDSEESLPTPDHYSQQLLGNPNHALLGTTGTD